MLRRLQRLTIEVLTLGVLIAVAGLCVPAVALANHQFSDVPTGASYHDFVDFLVDNGITTGCGAGTYCPGSPVTRAQMAIFLQRVLVLGGCSPDMVKSGPTCIDKYEASVWEVAPANTALITKIKSGTATLAELQAGGVQRGATSDDYGAGCPDTGNGCVNFYAVSIAGVPPSRLLTWFQAAAAARNAGKRLPTNAEWQAAALGTPDAQCHTTGASPAATGATAGCVSDVGAFDMVGNVSEWVADWVPRSTACGSWGAFSVDTQCLAGADTSGSPGALVRGGDFGSGPGNSGVFSVRAGDNPASQFTLFGFRAAR